MWALIVKLLPLVIKNLPIILAALVGLGKALEKAKPSPEVTFDEEALAALVQKLAEDAVTKVVNEHKREIVVRIPSDEEKEREARLDELVKILEERQREYEEEERQKKNQGK